MEKYKYAGLHTPRIPEVDSSPPGHGLLRNRSISNKHSKYFPTRLLTRSQTTIERGNQKTIKTTMSRELKYVIPKSPPPQFPKFQISPQIQISPHIQNSSSLPTFLLFVDCHHFHSTHNNHSRGFQSSG